MAREQGSNCRRLNTAKPEVEIAMQSITVRAESADDIKAIDVVHLSAFQGDDEVGLIGELRQSAGFNPALSLVAEFHNRIVGHILLTKVRLQRDPGGVDILALAPMAVVPSQSHRGIGSELVHSAIEGARKLDYGAIVVVGHPEFYQRLGFTPASRWNLRCNLPVPEDALTAVELDKGVLTQGGNVIYPSQFQRVY